MLSCKRVYLKPSGHGCDLPKVEEICMYVRVTSF